ALVEPFLRPFRRVIPPLGGVDLSPLVLLLIIQVVQLAVSRSWENGVLAASSGML
ncbi:MAG: YggT family protein, partial [Rhodocyclaceae bacterium]|nr:YggT family protein [Rhodocyclaceae bacterium]